MMLRKSFFFMCAVAGNIYGMHEPVPMRGHLELTHTRPADLAFSKIQQAFVPLHTEHQVTALVNGDRLTMFMDTEHDGSYRVGWAKRAMPIAGEEYSVIVLVAVHEFSLENPGECTLTFPEGSETPTDIVKARVSLHPVGE